MRQVHRTGIGVDTLGRQVGRWNSTGGDYVVIDGRRFDYTDTVPLGRDRVGDVYLERHPRWQRISRVPRPPNGIFG